ncbi:hypothetical protein [Leptospira yasudae]|uniref:hypothetical protein n=1 Tax=Leptospira yasudae TaxID=2202201 RepID=UPI001FEDF389|nr:hypothetical protein [Leptospira yasudae]
MTTETLYTGMKSAFLKINELTINTVLIVTTIFFFYCVRSPDKPEAAYSVLQQWIKSHSNTSTSQQEEQSDPCIPTNPTWNPGVLIDTGQTQCWSEREHYSYLVQETATTRIL